MLTTLPFKPLKSEIPDFALAQIWKGSLCTENTALQPLNRFPSHLLEPLTA